MDVRAVWDKPLAMTQDKQPTQIVCWSVVKQYATLALASMMIEAWIQ